MYKALYLIHTSCVFLSLAGFVWRGSLIVRGRALARWMKIAPHGVDALLLASAIGLALELQLNPLLHGWLAAKIVAVVAYIGFGLRLMRFSHTQRTRLVNFALALLCAIYIVLVALSKSPLPGIL